MHIRTITIGAREADVERAGQLASQARERLVAAGYQVQTLRLALSAVGSNRCGDFATIAQGFEEQALEAGFDHVAIGPQTGDRLAALPEALAATERLFAAATICGSDGTVYPDMIQAAAAIIKAISEATPGGFGNLRFAALAGVSETPFFPASHHDGGPMWMAIGCEAAALAVQATQEAAGPAALQRLTALIEQHDAQIRGAVAELAGRASARWLGCDWSLAPYPSPALSIGAAIEALSGVPFGSWGTLTAVRGLTSAIRAARVEQVGFSGVMLPILEDTVLAQRNREQRFTLRDLLAFSSVCGTGLDTIPLPGDTSPAQLAGILSEVATLSSALRKPLTARLLPIPGLQAGDILSFEGASDSQMSSFFCPTAVIRP